jgi:hypothetical protein
VARSIQLALDTARVLEELKQRKVHLSILSGSIKGVIREALGDCYDLFDEVRANEIDFDDEGVVEDIIGTRYDFETKPDFIRELIRDRRLDPLEVLFVGNSRGRRARRPRDAARSDRRASRIGSGRAGSRRAQPDPAVRSSEIAPSRW